MVFHRFPLFYFMELIMTISERGQHIQKGYVNFKAGIYWASVYWVVGNVPAGSTRRNEVSSPPNAGWSSCFVIDPDRESKTVKLFCPYTFQSFTVSRRSMEFDSLKPKHFVRQFFLTHLPQTWIEMRNRGWERDFTTAAHVMEAAGFEVPEAGEQRPPKSIGGGGKPAAKALSKAVKRTGRKGEVLTILMATPSILAVTEKLGIDRKNVLSQLFLLKKNHGIGYKVEGDAVEIELPEGVSDPFDGA